METDTRIKGKTFTCGWCHRSGVNKDPNGDLATHIVPGTPNTQCQGIQTYMQNGRTK